MSETKEINKKRAIGAAAREVGVAEYILRFWEKEFSCIQPEKGKGGRRYYYDKDIEILKKIKHLLHDEGYTIKGLQRQLERNKSLLKLTIEEIKNKDKRPAFREGEGTENISVSADKLERLSDFSRRLEEFINKIEIGDHSANSDDISPAESI